MASKRPPPDSPSGPKDAKKIRPSEEHLAAAKTGQQTAIQRQIEEVKARIAAQKAKAHGGGIHAPKPAVSPQPSSVNPALQARLDKIAAARAKIAADAATRQHQRVESPLPSHRNVPQTSTTNQIENVPTRARDPPAIEVHPALRPDAVQTYNPQRFSTVIGNLRAESPLSRPASEALQTSAYAPPVAGVLQSNPYLSSIPNEEGKASRKSRALLFNQQGKYINQAIQLRRQADLEELKRRIAQSARKAALEEDHTEKAFLVEKPPAKEWWDEALVHTTGYPDFDDDAIEAEQQLRLGAEDSVITNYIQHPVLVQPPQEKIKIPEWKIPMTQREMKKKRRQDRQEILKEKQAKIRLGLEMPEPPKVKRANLMRVLGEEAVRDPTAVEARVDREIAERQLKHNAGNEERKLTKEQRLEKLARNQEEDAAKGLHVCVFAIKTMVSPKHRYQIDVVAKQYALTGIRVFHPKVSLVVVEGGQHSIQKYKLLMLQRVKWTQNDVPKKSADEIHPKDREVADTTWLQPLDKQGKLIDLSGNSCDLIWGGRREAKNVQELADEVV